MIRNLQRKKVDFRGFIHGQLILLIGGIEMRRSILVELPSSAGCSPYSFQEAKRVRCQDSIVPCRTHSEELSHSTLSRVQHHPLMPASGVLRDIEHTV